MGVKHPGAAPAGTGGLLWRVSVASVPLGARDGESSSLTPATAPTVPPSASFPSVP